MLKYNHALGSGGLEFETNPLGVACLGVKIPIYPMRGRDRESMCLNDLVKCSKKPRYLGYQKKKRRGKWVADLYLLCDTFQNYKFETNNKRSFSNIHCYCPQSNFY